MTEVNHTIFKFSNLFKVRACTIRTGICLPDWKSVFQWNQWIFTHLVGGFNHLEKYYVVNGKDYPIYYGKIYKTCSKQPTRFLHMVQTHLEIVKHPPTLPPASLRGPSELLLRMNSMSPLRWSVPTENISWGHSSIWYEQILCINIYNLPVYGMYLIYQYMVCILFYYIYIYYPWYR